MGAGIGREGIDDTQNITTWQLDFKGRGLGGSCGRRHEAAFGARHMPPDPTAPQAIELDLLPLCNFRSLLFCWYRCLAVLRHLTEEWDTHIP